MAEKNKETYIKAGWNLYLGISSTFAGGIFASQLINSMVEGKLEKILSWGGLTLMDGMISVGNYLNAIKKY